MTIYPGDGDLRHGTYSGYVNHGCRCDDCRAAHTAKIREYRAAHPEYAERQRRQQTAKRRAAGIMPKPKSPRWPLCAVEGCPDKSKVKCLCPKHYKRLLTHGDPLVVTQRGNKTQERCGKGHRLEDPNLYWYTDASGKRHRKCKTCHDERMAARKRQLRDERSAA